MAGQAQHHRIAPRELAGIDLAAPEPRVVARIPTVRQPNTVTVDTTTGTLAVTGTADGVLQLLTPVNTAQAAGPVPFQPDVRYLPRAPHARRVPGTGWYGWKKSLALAPAKVSTSVGTATPSICSRMMSACPACRAHSSTRCTR